MQFAIRSIRPLAAAALFMLAGLAPAWGQDRPAHSYAASQPIAGRYMVIFRNHVSNPAAEAASLARGAGGQVHHTYSNAIKGFAATLPAQALQGLRNNPNVDFIEQDQAVSLNQAQAQATWGLDRIDQVDRPLDTVYHYAATGSGVFAYIIDTGIRPDHAEFAGRIMAGVTAISDGRGTLDCNGHGTHVAGTVGGTTWGAAKQVTLVPVRVLDCRGSGSWSGVIAGIDWVAGNAVRPAVANMSLGGGYSAAVNNAVAGAVASGVTMVVAAGNSNANACNYSPASEPVAITVGATTSADVRASYSNYGRCVDLFAPGSGITSAWHTSASATNTISGTSMASPHVAGTAALVLQANPDASPAAVAAFLASTATPNRIGSAGSGSPNMLLYSLGSGAAVEPPAVSIATSSLSATTKGGRNWRVTVTIGVRNVASGAAVANVTASGSFAPGGAASCVTGTTGTCSINAAFASSVAATQFTVTGLSGAGMVYDSSANAATQITITRP